MESLERVRSVREAVLMLKPEYRAVIVLRHFMDCSYEDAAEGDTSGDPNGYELTPEQAAAVMADPDIAPPEDTLPAAVASALDDTNSTSSSTDGTVPGP